jgi:hypothetical protein
MPKPTIQDLELYLKVLDRKKVEFAGYDLEEENVERINQLQLKAIQKTYEP